MYQSFFIIGNYLSSIPEGMVFLSDRGIYLSSDCRVLHYKDRQFSFIEFDHELGKRGAKIKNKLSEFNELKPEVVQLIDDYLQEIGFKE